MERLVVDGSHFGGVLKAVARLVNTKYQSRDVELVCNEELEVYILQTTGEVPVIIATLDY